MMYLDEAIELEDKMYNALKDDELGKFEELLNAREALYKSFAEESPEEFKAYLDSDAFKVSGGKINGLYNEKKESLIREMKELALSRKASDEYMGSAGAIQGVFSKRV